jgi:hypothetical protein
MALHTFTLQNEPDGVAALNLSAEILCQNERLGKICRDQAASAIRLQWSFRP